MANRKPDKQIFSSDLIYQTINAVKLYSEQTQFYQINDKEISNHKDKEPGQETRKYALEEKISDYLQLPFKLSEIFLMQRRWANRSKAPNPAWFNYAYYNKTSFSPEQAKDIIDGFNDPETYPWDLLIKHIEKHTQLKTIEDAKNWILKIRKQKPPITEEIITQLHHHLLQLYSHFPTINYIHGGLYENFIKPELRSNDKIKRKGFYIFVDKAETKSTYPPYKVWKIEDNIATGDNKSYPQDEDFDEDERRVVKFFTEYLLPILNFEHFEGKRKDDFTFEEAPFDHMLFLPLYDEYADGEFHGFFRGWLFQVFSLNEKKLDELKLDKEEIKKRARTPLFGEFDNKLGPIFDNYIKICLSRTNYLTSELMRGVLREVLNQRLSNKETFRFLESNLCLLGNWESPVTREIQNEDYEFIKTSLENGQVNLSINLDPDFLEKDSATFISFDKLNEDIKGNQELVLKFGADFKPPSEDRKGKYNSESEENAYSYVDPYYLRLGNNIYTILARLKSAKWAELKSQEQGQIEEAKSQVGKWSHALQTKLALLDHTFSKKDIGESITDEINNINGTLSSLRRTAVALSYYQRVQDYLEDNKLKLFDLRKSNGVEGFKRANRSVGNLLLDAFYLIAAKIRLGSEKFADVKGGLNSFYESCSRINELPKLIKGDADESLVSLEDLKIILPDDGTVNLIIENDTILREIGVWETIDIPTKGGNIRFYYDITIGVIIDEILSNACKYVAPTNGTIRIDINLELEDSELGKQVVLKVINTCPLDDIKQEIADGDLIKYYAKRDKGLGLFFNKELCSTLVADWTKIYSVRAENDFKEVHAIFKFPVDEII